MKELTIRMKDDMAEILLYDQIGEDPFFGDGISAKTFREQIKAVKARTINLRINSPGGSVTEGAAMMSVLDDFKGTVEVDIDGMAASAASVVAMSGDTIRMASNALMMIHDPYAGVMGGADEMRRTADLLDKVKGQILDAYGRRAKADRKAIAKMMTDETWFNGQEAVEAGLADETTAPMQMAASFDLTKFGYRKVPEKPGPTPEQIAAFSARKERFKTLCS